MEEIFVAFITSDVFKWAALAGCGLIVLEVIAKILEPKSKKNPLYWLDLFLETLVQTAHLRLRQLADYIRGK